MPAIFCHNRSKSLLIIVLMSKTPALDSENPHKDLEAENTFYQLLLYGQLQCSCKAFQVTFQWVSAPHSSKAKALSGLIWNSVQ